MPTAAWHGTLWVMSGKDISRWLALTLLVSLLAWPSYAAAQTTDVELNFDPASLGLDGAVRLGTWTPLRVTLNNRAAEPRAVIVRWLLNDADGDRVFAQRQVTLNPQRTQQVWLYATPSAQARAEDLRWSVQVLDAEVNELLASRDDLIPDETKLIKQSDGAIAVLSARSMGLEPYTRADTQHEAIRMIRGLTLGTLPDRWFGLSAVQTLIWARDGADPVTDPMLTYQIENALREWVHRGGHLVVVLPSPSFGPSWPASKLRDLLPVSAERIRTARGLPPTWAGAPRSAETFEVEMSVFDVEQGDGVEVLLRNRDHEPAVVAKRYGFGRVTLVGLDLAAKEISDMGLPNGRYRVWNTIFNWQAPVFSEAYIEAEINAQRMSRPDYRSAVNLGQFVPAVIAMQNTAGPALLWAVIVFTLYWVLAGPVASVVLKRKGLLQHSWLVFIAVVLVFSVIAWGGAAILQPRQMSVAHFSVIDYDARTDQARTHSWFSLYVPSFGEAQVAVGEADELTQNTLASPGLASDQQTGGFLDPKSYVVNGGQPQAMAVPVRSTAKQFEMDYRGPLATYETNEDVGRWVMPQGQLYVDQTFWPRGELSHGLPGDLENVLILYCPGDGQNPWVWRYGDWPAKTILRMSAPNEMTPARQADRLVKAPPAMRYDKDRKWKTEGFLGQLISQHPGEVDLLGGSVASNVAVQLVEMLSFYSALPPPNFRETSFAQDITTYHRTLGRSLDITPLTAGRRVIIIGYLPNSPMPAPLTVDEQPVDSAGWTVVRWIYDL